MTAGAGSSFVTVVTVVTAAAAAGIAFGVAAFVNDVELIVVVLSDVV